MVSDDPLRITRGFERATLTRCPSFDLEQIVPALVPRTGRGGGGSGDLIAHAYRQQYSDETTRKSANPRKRHGVCSEASEELQPVTPAGLSETRRDVAKVRLLGLEPRTYGLKVRCSTD